MFYAMASPLANEAPSLVKNYGATGIRRSSSRKSSSSNHNNIQTTKEGNGAVFDSIRSFLTMSQDDNLDDSSDASSLDLVDDVDQLARQDELLQRVQNFDLSYNPDKGYRATQLKINSMARPHMRAFHASWLCFFASWLLWFSVAPLLPYVQESFSTPNEPITKEDIWTSNMWSLSGAVLLRIVLGPLCDQHGGRVILTGVLAVCAGLCGTLGLAQDFTRFMVWRALLGCVGGTLVPAQYWITAQFVPEICGTTMAMVAGWGAMGGGVAQVFMGSVVFPLSLKLVDGNQDMAWRVALIVPAGLALTVAYLCYKFADDGPLGSIQEVQSAGLSQPRSAADSFRSGALHLNSWLLFLQFAAGLGIELTMDSCISLHLAERFELSIAQASSLASLFGLMNIFARGFGGWISDKMYRRYSLQGRLYIHWLFMVLEGVFIFVFCETNQLNTTLLAMVLFAVFGQMSMGTCFGIVPYVDPPNTGTVAGIVGAGGNVGGVLLSSVFRASPGLYAFRVMGYFCIAMSLLTPLIVIRGYRGICFGENKSDTNSNKQGDKSHLGEVSQSALLVPQNVMVHSIT